MKFAVMGAGAIGSYYGGLLSRAGEEVLMIARGKHRKAMKEKGLRIQSYLGGFHVHPKVVEKPKSLSNFNCILLTVKSYDTEKTAGFLKDRIQKNALICCIQNGIKNEEIVHQILPENPIIGANAFIASSVIRPGVISHTGAGKIVLGNFFPKKNTAADQLFSIFQNVGMDVKKEDDIMLQKWIKLVWNAAFNPLSVLCDATVQDLLENKESLRLVKELMRETIQIGQAHGYALRNTLIAHYIKRSIPLGKYKTSMLLDAERGKRIELDGITGELLKKAKQKKIEVPYNQFLFSSLKAKFSF